MPLSIRPVRTAADLTKFIKMVWPIYKDDPMWVPPVIADRKKLLDRKRNPFYKHSEMEMFLAEDGARVVGRVAAIINRNHNQTHDDTVGFFGFFESIDSQPVADLLLSTAENWLAERGMTAMRGPANPSMNDEVGLLVEGFDDPPQILMTYNPKYYIRLIESFGLKNIKELYAYRMVAGRFVTPKLERVNRIVREREKLVVRPVNFKNKAAFQRDVETLREIYNSAWVPTWGFVKMTDEEFDFLAADLKQIANPDLTLIAESAGRAVGFALALPDINQVLINNRSGGMIGAGYQLLFRKKDIKRARIIVLGVIPEFQKRGVDAALYYEVGNNAVKKHALVEGEASWVLEDNLMMNRAAELMNGEIYKRYRIYEKTINKN
jgi:GNAT superfamily N-acetyltransferase